MDTKARTLYLTSTPTLYLTSTPTTLFLGMDIGQGPKSPRLLAAPIFTIQINANYAIKNYKKSESKRKFGWEVWTIA